MKRMLQFFAPALVVTAAASPVWSLSLSASLSSALSVAASKTHLGATAPLTASYAISKFDSGIVSAFQKAWQRSGNGTTSLEGVVLILRMADGSFSGREMGSTNEHNKFTFRWHPATIAVVHTHPNSSDPRPHDEDIVVAHKHRVPVFTITRSGMYVYDPNTKMTTRVMVNLDWLDPAKWSRSQVASQ